MLSHGQGKFNNMPIQRPQTTDINRLTDSVLKMQGHPAGKNPESRPTAGGKFPPITTPCFPSIAQGAGKQICEPSGQSSVVIPSTLPHSGYGPSGGS